MPPRSGNSRGPTQEVKSPVREESTPKDAHASTPAKLGGSRQEREEAQEKFEAASRAFYLLVDTGQPDRLESTRTH